MAKDGCAGHPGLCGHRAPGTALADARELFEVNCMASELDNDRSKILIAANQYKFVPYGCLRDKDVANLIRGIESTTICF